MGVDAQLGLVAESEKQEAQLLPQTDRATRCLSKVC